MTPLTLSTVLSFPRAGGRTLQECIDQDLQYVKWLHRERKIDFDLDSWQYFLDAAKVTVSGYKTHNFKPSILKYRR